MNPGKPCSHGAQERNKKMKEQDEAYKKQAEDGFYDG